MKRRSRTGALIASIAVLCTLAASAPTAAYTRPGSTSIVSVSSAERQGRTCSAPTPQCDGSALERSSISANGRFVAFASASDGLVPGDENHMTDIFVRDVIAGTTRIVSVSSAGDLGVGPELRPGSPVGGAHASAPWQLSSHPSISTNGRYVAFASTAVNLVLGDTNTALDVFVHDLRTSRTERVSVNSRGEQASFDASKVSAIAAGMGGVLPHSYFPSISANGRFVSFTSFAMNLVAKDRNEWGDIFVRDRLTKKTTRVSVRSGGGESRPFSCDGLAAIDQCRYWYSQSSISASGRWVAFDSSAPDLVPGDTNLMTDVFVHDRHTRKTERVSVSSSGDQATEPLEWRGEMWSGSSLSGLDTVQAGHAISADGRFVTFVSRADNLIPADTNSRSVHSFGGQDVFLRDRGARRTTRLSVTSVGHEAYSPPTAVVGSGDTNHAAPSMSPDGRFVVFDGQGLQAGRFAQAEGAYVHDRITGATDFTSPMIDRSHGGSNPSGGAKSDISTGGRYVTMTSHSWPQGWERKDATRGVDVFLRDRGREVGLIGSSADGQGGSGTEPLCVAGVCVPNAQVAEMDVRGGRGEDASDLVSGSLVRRAGGELFLRIGVRRLPALSSPTEPAGFTNVYGARLRTGSGSYEVRAVPGLPGAAGAVIGLFACTATSCDDEVAALQGGYGTTGEEVVVAIPVDMIGASRWGGPPDAVVFAGQGTYLSGAHVVHDRLRLR